MHRLIALLMLCLLVGCAAPASQPDARPAQNLGPPPSADALRRLGSQINAWVILDGPSFATAEEAEIPADAFRLGRPSRVALLDQETIFQFAPGESLRDRLRPTGGWAIPVYQDDQLVSVVELDDAYTPIGAGQQPAPRIVAGYDDPEAEVWYVKYQSYPEMVLLSRPSGETMATFHTEPNALYPPIAALGGQEVAPEVMLGTLADVIDERCRLFWVFRQC